jgi:hypothetical protein
MLGSMPSSSPRPGSPPSSSASEGRRLRAASLATCVALGAFIGALAIAIAAYPGGSWTAPSELGFSLLRNFWCDLLRSRAIGGLDNATSQRWADLAFAALAAGSLPYWYVAASLFERHRRRLILMLGSVSAVGLGLMAVLPSDSHPLAHGLVALAGGFAGMVAGAQSAALRLEDEPPLASRRVAAALTLSFAASNAGVYVYVAYLHGAETLAQPVVQKLATLSLVIWMMITIRRAAGAVPSELYR